MSTELLEKKLEFYREQTDKVRQFIYSRKDIGEPCQPLYDAIFDKLNEQQQEIERLKAEIECWRAYKNEIDEALNSGDGVYIP